jgi:hypothetical protein
LTVASDTSIFKWPYFAEDSLLQAQDMSERVRSNMKCVPGVMEFPGSGIQYYKSVLQKSITAMTGVGGRSSDATLKVCQNLQHYYGEFGEIMLYQVRRRDDAISSPYEEERGLRMVGSEKWMVLIGQCCINITTLRTLSVLHYYRTFPHCCIIGDIGLFHTVLVVWYVFTMLHISMHLNVFPVIHHTCQDLHILLSS